MAIKIVTASGRLKQKSAIKGVIAGEPKVGKTSLLRTLDPETTLALDLEAGMLSVQDWPGDSINVREAAIEFNTHPWNVCRAIASALSGPDYSKPEGGVYSPQHYQWSIDNILPKEAQEKYRTIFVDSITVAGRFCLSWAKTQPQAISAKTGNEDGWAVYGLHGQEMITWLTQLQHIPQKNVWFACILERKVDSFKRPFWSLQIDGSKTGLELPGIVDEVLTLAQLGAPDGSVYRAFVCHKVNEWGFPAGDRSGTLNLIEEPNLTKVMEKIEAAKRVDALKTSLPTAEQLKDNDVPF